MRAVAVLVPAVMLAACGKDNFGVSAAGCDAPQQPQKAFQCATFERKPWFSGLDEFSGFFVAESNAQPPSEHILRTLIEAKGRNRYVSIGGETPEQLAAALEEVHGLWSKEKPDLSGLLVQVHAAESVEKRAVAALKAMGTEPKFYALKRPASHVEH